MRKDMKELLPRLTVGAKIAVKGELTAHPRPEKPNEVQIACVEVVGDCPVESYPLQKKARLGDSYVRSLPHMRPRTNGTGAMLRIRDALARGLRSALADRSYLEAHTPVLTANDCEGGSELFEVLPATQAQSLRSTPPATPPAMAAAHPPGADAAAAEGGLPSRFFGRAERVYLSVSGQLHAEALANGVGRVFTFGPTFRAENSDTTRHLAEFWMLEPEAMGLDMHGAADLAEACVRRALQQALDDCSADLEFFDERFAEDGGVVEHVRLAADDSQPWQRVSYTEAIELVGAGVASGSLAGSPAPEWGADLGGVQEKWLAEVHGGGRPLLVTDYPAEIKAFYMRREGEVAASVSDRSEALAAALASGADLPLHGVQAGRATVRGMDLLAPKIGELMGGSQREERLEVLWPAMRRRRLLSPEYDLALCRLVQSGAERFLFQDMAAFAEEVPKGLGDLEGAALAWYSGELGLDAEAAAALADRAKALAANPSEMAQHATATGALDWYLDLRRFGTEVHSGWGLGFERLVRFTTGISNVRDVIPMPRAVGLCRM